MLFSIIIAVLSFICFVLIFLYLFGSQPTLPKTYEEFKYEILYQIIGFNAIVEDYVYRSDNVFVPIKSRENDVAVITGGNRGIGLCVVTSLLKIGMTVVIGCRNVESGEASVNKIRQNGITSGKAVVLALDVSSLESVKKFSIAVKDQFKNIHVLINNAGVMFSPYSETVDGFESQLAINYLGHFYLTHLLLSTLCSSAKERTKNSRIVNVSSCAHKAGNINFDDFNCRKLYIPSAAYGQSKLAQVMFTRTLNDALRKSQEPVQVHAVHPGVVNTNLFEHTAIQKYIPWLPKLFFKSPEQGSTSILYSALSESVENKGGTYVSNCGFATISPLARNDEVSTRLFEFTKTLLNINKFGSN